MRALARTLDHFFLLRPILFFPAWTSFLAGIWGGRYFGHDNALLPRTVSFAGMMVVLTVIMGCVYVLNQIMDVATDRANEKQFLIANFTISVKHATVQAVVMGVGGLGAAFFMDFHYGIGFSLLILIAGILYNFPPASWKNHAWPGLLTNGLGGMIIYILGWTTAASYTRMLWHAFAYTLAFMAVTLFTTIPDLAGDKKTGKNTFGVRYGIHKTAVLALILETASLAMACIVKDRLLLFPALIAFPFFVVAALRKDISNVVRATKISVAALALAVCVVFPWYAVLLLVVFLLTRIYYKKRFHFSYPNFSGSS